MVGGRHVSKGLPLAPAVPNINAERIFVEPLPPAEPSVLPEGTFFTVNNSTGASDPVVFTADSSSLAPGHILEWLRYGTFLIPRPVSPGLTDSFFYLGATDQEDTFIVKWKTPGASGSREVDDGQRVNLTTHIW
jgi:hypothetical protein